MLETGSLVKGRYEVTGLLAHGGMSWVYMAQDCLTGASLVIKEAMRRQACKDEIMEQSLILEGHLLKDLDNPHLPKIYEVVEEADQILMVMDYVEGQSLDQILDQYGPLPPEMAVHCGLQICDVFAYLHSQFPPIIYRDMKPANVILQPDGMVKMIDFGTARTWKGDQERSSDTMLIGTEGFAAPEQFGGLGESDARTDIFCLGVTLFNLVTGHSPYTRPFGITPLGDWDPQLRDCALDRIIQRCTQRDPDSRYQSAQELKEDLLAAVTPAQEGVIQKLMGRFGSFPGGEDAAYRTGAWIGVILGAFLLLLGILFCRKASLGGVICLILGALSLAAAAISAAKYAKS